MERVEGRQRLRLKVFDYATPGGYFVTNYAVSPLPPLEASASIVTPVFFDRQGNGDTLFCYQRR